MRDYVKLPDRHKRLLQGFTTGVEFTEKEQAIPAYILGAWLGDGHSATTALTSMDKELVAAWYDYAAPLNLKVRISTNNSSGKAKTYHITSGKANGHSNRNPLMNELRTLNLIQNKHIPFNYKTGSSQQRLELLAGLIDTDGHRSGETFFLS